MAQLIKIRSSVSPGRVPTTLEPAELAINLKDQKLYSADVDGTVFELTGGSSSSGVTKLIAGANITLTPSEGIGDVTIEAAGGSGGITSVNGDTGPAVVLDAADVGALPDDTPLDFVPLGSWSSIPALT